MDKQFKSSKSNMKKLVGTKAIEQSFLSMPKAVLASIAKEISVEKKTFLKSARELSKLEILLKKLNQEKKVLFKSKNNNSKKRLIEVNKNINKQTKIMNKAVAESQLIDKKLLELSCKKAKYLALDVQIAKFKKNLTKEVSKVGKISKGKSVKLIIGSIKNKGSVKNTAKKTKVSKPPSVSSEGVVSSSDTSSSS